MARGQDEPSDGDEGPILSPEELDISNDEHVAELDEGRYVVSPNEPIGDIPGHVGSDESTGDTDQSPLPDQSSGADSSQSQGSADRNDSTPDRDHDRGHDGRAGAAVTEDEVRAWLADQFDETDSRYGFDVTATFDGSTEQRQMISNDVVTIFESLVLWYAQQIDSGTPVEEVLGILLMEANVPIRYPTAGLQQVVESSGLDPDDTIADLVKEVDEDGFRL